MKTLKNARVHLMRHGNALKVEGMSDLYRPLSDKGIQQAQALRASYNGTLKSVKIAFVSPAPRVSCTVAIAIAGSGAPIVPLPELWTPEGRDGKIIDAAFEEHGYNVPRYFSCRKTVMVCKRFGLNALLAIERELRKRDLVMTTSDTIIVGGHAVLLNFIGDALTQGNSDEIFVLRELPETGVFEVILQNGKARAVHSP